MILGSYNWTDAAVYDNDENTLTIHDRELARAYYREWGRVQSELAPFYNYLPLVMKIVPTPAPTPGPTPTSHLILTGNTVITHIFYDRVKVSAEPDEYVEIRNGDALTSDVRNWTLRDEANHLVTFPFHLMQPGQVCRIYME